MHAYFSIEHIIRTSTTAHQSIQAKHKQVISIHLSYLVGDVVGKPIKPLVQPFTRCSTSALDVPAFQEIVLCLILAQIYLLDSRKATVTLTII